MFLAGAMSARRRLEEDPPQPLPLWRGFTDIATSTLHPKQAKKSTFCEKESSFLVKVYTFLVNDVNDFST